MNCRSPVIRVAAWVAVWAAAAASLSGCAASTAPPPDADTSAGALLERLLPTSLLLVGEQHDAPEHQALQRALVQQLAARQQLAALVVEMAETGARTTGLPRDASEAQVQQALRWGPDNGGWPWPSYAPVVMAAVRAGVPVFGGNLPRAEMRAAMGQTTLDGLLPSVALERQRNAIQEGHCGLLPAPQITPMTRIQIARDQAMARTAAAAVRPGQTVLLVAGNNHVQRDLGVPQHLPTGLAHRVVVALAQPGHAEAAPSGEPSPGSDAVWSSPPRAPRDYCGEMKRSMGR